jgi:hypothetical protein
MATAAPVSCDVHDLRHQVIATYERVAWGRMPTIISTAGRTMPMIFSATTARSAIRLLLAPLRPGPGATTVLDHACGAGMDLLLAGAALRG